MPDLAAASAARDAAQAALTTYRALVRAGTISDAAPLAALRRVRDNATRELRAAERGLSGRQELRRQVRGRPREGGLTQYQREERARRERIQAQTGFRSRYERDKARAIAEANQWMSYRYATTTQARQNDANLALLFVDNFTPGRTLTDRRRGQRDRFIAAVDRWSWRLWRDEYDRRTPGVVRVRYARDTAERLDLGGSAVG